jgi:hypothetical protein
MSLGRSDMSSLSRDGASPAPQGTAGRSLALPGLRAACAAAFPLAPRGDFGEPPKSNGRAARSTLERSAPLVPPRFRSLREEISASRRNQTGGPPVPPWSAPRRLRRRATARSARRCFRLARRHLPSPAPQPPPRRDARAPQKPLERGSCSLYQYGYNEWILIRVTASSLQ